jgi:hypothetical protein
LNDPQPKLQREAAREAAFFMLEDGLDFVRGSASILKSLRHLSVLCDSAVRVFKAIFTAETRRSRRLRREKLKLGHDSLFFVLWRSPNIEG